MAPKSRAPKPYVKIWQPKVMGVASWPEVVGLTPEQAEPIIIESNPLVFTLVHPLDGCITNDFVYKRVRLFVNKDGKIGRVPKIG